MMIKTVAAEKKELRKFSMGLAVLLVLIGMIQYFWDGQLYRYFIPAGVIALAVGLLLPGWMKPVMWLMIRIGNVLNWIMTNLILALLFYLVFTSIALIWWVIGKRPLDLKFPDTRQSYWIKRSAEETSPQQFEKQF
jgi:hypothetical protein